MSEPIKKVTCQQDIVDNISNSLDSLYDDLKELQIDIRIHENMLSVAKQMMNYNPTVKELTE